ncbi:MAG: hypothetical protein JWN70_5654 [Planctomycetaceae bacterium]|nr:hypothetical protein [Planctomycetaceae bacterium]
MQRDVLSAVSFTQPLASRKDHDSHERQHRHQNQPKAKHQLPDDQHWQQGQDSQLHQESNGAKHEAGTPFLRN